MPQETPVHLRDDEERARAFGFAQRRSWVFWAWWYGAVLAISGAVQAGLAGILGQSAEHGVSLMVLGSALAAAGWLLTVGWRFTRKLPKPASDIPRVEQGIRITPNIVRVVVIGAVLIVIALALFSPQVGFPDALPLLGMLVGFLWSVAAGLAYTGRIMKNGADLYARWLSHH
jgi:hypothetical protein